LFSGLLVQQVYREFAWANIGPIVELFMFRA